MVRFMICDTDVEYANKLGQTLHAKYDPCSVEYVYGPTALEVSLRADSGGADILITEIELRGKCSISIISQYLKESSPLQVIYMTTDINYCTEVYETPHHGFLVKPIRSDLLDKSIQRAVGTLQKRKENGIVVQKNGNVHIVDKGKLCYVEGEGRIARLVMIDDSLETYEKLSCLSLRLGGTFIQCHKSYLVNMNYVYKYLGDVFLMENGDSIPISQSKRKEVRERFLNYIESGRVR